MGLGGQPGDTVATSTTLVIICAYNYGFQPTMNPYEPISCRSEIDPQ